MVKYIQPLKNTLFFFLNVKLHAFIKFGVQWHHTKDTALLYVFVIVVKCT